MKSATSNLPALACIGCLALGGAVPGLSTTAPALELGAPFADHAVLQQQMPAPVWGWSKAGTKVTVEFAGQHKTATAATNGKWMVELDPLTASFEPREMTITEAGGASRTLKDILVGEVWFASGQSNMQWLASKADCVKLHVEPVNGVAPVRECSVTDCFAALHPVEHATAEWKAGNYGDYSAIALAFAHKLHHELKVPVGILNCSFSQTSIEAWTPRAGFRLADGEYNRQLYQKTLLTDPATPEHKAAWDAFYRQIEDELRADEERVQHGEAPKGLTAKPPGNLNDNRDASWLFNARLNPMIPFAVRGAIWNQGYANISGGITYYQNLHALIAGWRDCWKRPDLPVYFHQFYCPRPDSHPSIEPLAEMRLGAWLARDIPHTGMASQIDVEGAIHYRSKAVPGQRLALHALKNQYGKEVVTDGPMFRSYAVDGNKVIISFDHAAGGLVVAETGTNATGKETAGATGFSDPKIIPNGDDQVVHFHLAGENRVWHPAKVRINGEQAVVTADGVTAPRGVSYGTGGIGFRPNLYNRALLPLSPFIVYDHKLVTSKNWPDQPLKIAGVEPDPNAGGLLEEYRKMPLLAAGFTDHAVFQAGEPVTIWGSAVHDWGYEAKGKAHIRFEFNGIDKQIPVTPGMREWQVTVPAMEASADPKKLRVTFSIDGQLAHQRVCKNILVGDVWYVGGLIGEDALADTAEGPLRALTRKAKRTRFRNPSRYSVSVSTTPGNRFASAWATPKGGLAAELGRRIHAKTGKPVGIICMDGYDLTTKEWIGFDHLKDAPGLMDDYRDVAAVRPGNPIYSANVRRHLEAWKTYWGDYIPQLIATARVPDGAAWGSFPTLGASLKSTAAQGYNVLVHPFTHTRCKGIMLMTSPLMCGEDQGAAFAKQLPALAASWRATFGNATTPFFYALPAPSLAPQISQPATIESGTALPVSHWPVLPAKEKGDKAAAAAQLTSLLDELTARAYP